MRKLFIFLLVFCYFVALGSIGLAQEVTSSEEAIKNSQELKTVKEQVDFLIKQANTFINSKAFEQAIETAQYILSNLDKGSAEAKGIIEIAKEELTKAAQNTVTNLKNKIGGFGQ